MSIRPDLQSDIEHPFPRKGRVSTGWLFTGLVGGPTAWVLQNLMDYGIASDACTLTQGAHGQLRAAGFDGEPVILLTVDLVLLGVAVASACLSWRHWLATKDATGGLAKPTSGGDGRTHFIAFCGLMSGAIFTLAILFGAVQPLMIPVCWRWR